MYNNNNKYSINRSKVLNIIYNGYAEMQVHLCSMLKFQQTLFYIYMHEDNKKGIIVIVIVIVILYSAGTYIYIMDEKSLKCDDALKDCWRNQQPKHKSLQNTTTKTHRYRTLRTFIART